jgi:multidrug efflux system membrane fusion protein
VDSATGTITLKATFSNADQQLWPGASVDVVLTLGTDRQALVVPSQAVRDAQDGSYVFVVGRDHTAQQRPVEVLRSTPRLAVLREGVQAGDEVVTDGYIRLRNGTPVTIQKPAPGAEHANAGGADTSEARGARP